MTDTTPPMFVKDLPSSSLFSIKHPPAILYHYTDYDGAAGIISSKSLRLTKLRYLNDKSELTFGISQFKSLARDLWVGSKELKDFLVRFADQLTSFEQINICVASFSENRDLLSQWRAYGRSGCRMALGFSTDAISAPCRDQSIGLLKCVYQPEEHNRILQDLVNNLFRSYTSMKNAGIPSTEEELIGRFNSTFLTVAPVLKHPGFSEEKEWRLVKGPISWTDPSYRAYFSNSRVSQYYELNLASQKFLKEIMIGPAPDMDSVSDALHTFLMKNGITDVGGGWSRIPYRSD